MLIWEISRASNKLLRETKFIIRNKKINRLRVYY